MTEVIIIIRYKFSIKMGSAKILPIWICLYGRFNIAFWTLVAASTRYDANRVIFKLMKIDILLFGIVREKFGEGRITREFAQNPSVENIVSLIKSEQPTLAGLKSLLVAINDEYAENHDLAHPGDEVAIIPPVSGG